MTPSLFGGMSRNAWSRATHWSRSCRRWTRTSVFRSRAAIIFAATTVLPNAVVAASTPVSCLRSARGRFVLFRRQLAEKPCPERPSLLAFVAQLGRNAGVAEKAQQIVEASPREGDMFREQLGTGDDAWLAERRQAHGLRRIELGVLERGQPCDAVHQRRRKLRPVDVDLIAQHDLDRVGKLALDRRFLAAAGRRRGPWLIVLFRRGKPHAENLSRGGSFGHDREQLAPRQARRSLTDMPIDRRRDGNRHRERRCCHSREAGSEAAARSDCRTRPPASCPGSERTDHTNRNRYPGSDPSSP